MTDYPDYFPPFMRDFHDQKDLFKAFYVWLVMMDNRREIDGAEKFDAVNKRRVQMCGWMDFNVLVASLIDFLYQHGWQIQRSRKKSEFADITFTIAELNELTKAWWSICEPDAPLAYPREKAMEIISGWSEWLRYMPKDVQVKIGESAQEEATRE